MRRFCRAPSIGETMIRSHHDVQLAMRTNKPAINTQVHTMATAARQRLTCRSARSSPSDKCYFLSATSGTAIPTDIFVSPIVCQRGSCGVKKRNATGERGRSRVKFVG